MSSISRHTVPHDAAEESKDSEYCLSITCGRNSALVCWRSSGQRRAARTSSTSTLSLFLRDGLDETTVKSGSCDSSWWEINASISARHERIRLEEGSECCSREADERLRVWPSGSSHFLREQGVTGDLYPLSSSSPLL